MSSDPSKTVKLMKIVEGKNYLPRSWKRLWIRMPVHYSLDEQLSAIRELGKANSKEALEFLKNVYTPTVNRKTLELTDGNREWTEECWESEYRNVGEPLRRTLYESHETQGLEYYWVYRYSTKEGDPQRDFYEILKDKSLISRIKKREKTQKTFEEAIRKLESSLSLNSKTELQ